MNLQEAREYLLGYTDYKRNLELLKCQLDYYNDKSNVNDEIESRSLGGGTDNIGAGKSSARPISKKTESIALSLSSLSKIDYEKRNSIMFKIKETKFRIILIDTFVNTLSEEQKKIFELYYVKKINSDSRVEELLDKFDIKTSDRTARHIRKKIEVKFMKSYNEITGEKENE